VWVEDRQICAIGLAIQKMTSLHGIALNVSTNLDYDQVIVPCGLPDRGITSIEKELQRPVIFAEVQNHMLHAIEDAFQQKLVETNV
jgi:lipoyl(octanoyl) transferase